MTGKLPLWRAIAGFGVLGSLLAVLMLLAPVYVENYRLTRYVQALAADPRSVAAPDETLRALVMDRARDLNLPIPSGQVQIERPGGKLQLHMKYIVTESLAHYQLVDLHLEAKASAR